MSFPKDLVAEEGALARALEGDASALHRLCEDNFHSAGNAAIFIAAQTARDLGRPLNVDTIEAILRERRVHYAHSIDIRERLLEILDRHEWGSSTRRYVDRVLDAWRARAIARALEHALAEVCAGVDPRSALGDLGRVIRPMLSMPLPTSARRAA